MAEESSRAPRRIPFSPEHVRDIVAKEFALTGTVTELGSNEDQNFLVAAAGGAVVVKLTGPTTDRVTLEAQNAALRHVLPALGATGIASPGVHESRSGDDIIGVTSADGIAHHVRVLDFVDGGSAGGLDRLEPHTATGLGRTAAAVVGALADFEHPGLEPNERWDLRNGAAVVRMLLDRVDEPLRSVVGQALESAERRIAAVADRLPVQVIHGDVTGDNIVLDDEGHVVGVIDFGDLAPGWRVAELAVAVTSLLKYGPDSSADALRAIHAFDELLPLTDDEIAAIWPLVALRATVLIASGADIAHSDPDNTYASVRRPFERLILDGALALEFDEAELLIRERLGRVDSADASGGVGVIVPGEASVDLSVWSAAHDGGRWRDADADTAALHDAWRRHGAAATRYGEYRLRPLTPLGWRGARTLALGIDVAVSAETTLTSPHAGTAVHSTADSLGVLLDDGLTLHLSGVTPRVEAGSPVQAGDPIAQAPGAAAAATIFHMQLCAVAGLVPPRFVEPGFEDAWRVLCPDPSALLGLPARAPEHAPTDEVLAARDSGYARVQGHYYLDPPQIERGWRHTLIDTRGRMYLDMVNNVAVLGHGDPRMAAAVNAQLLRLNTNSRFLYESLSEFVTELTSRTPEGLDTVFLVNSGSEAVDLALRMAQAATGRRHIAAIHEAYHGWSMGSDGVSSSLADNPRALETRPDWVHLLPAPHRHEGGDTDGGTSLDSAIAALELLKQRGIPLAGVIAEPVFGNGGGIILPDGYLAGLWQTVRSEGGLCISDEVQVGYGRLGRHFWGFEQQGVVPDIITMAKAMGNGHPLGAVITTKKIADALAQSGSFFSSAGGSPVSCVVGTTVLRILDSDALMHNARDVGDYLKERLLSLAARIPRVGVLHGMGLYLGLEIMDAVDASTPDPDAAKAICDALLAEGVILQRTGDRKNVLKIKPPMTIDEQAVDHFVDALERVMLLAAARESM